MKIGALTALDAALTAVPKAWLRAAVAYTLLPETVLLRADNARAGAPEDLNALPPWRLAEQLLALRATSLEAGTI